jgi:hypothetical protein
MQTLDGLVHADALQSEHDDHALRITVQDIVAGIYATGHERKARLSKGLRQPLIAPSTTGYSTLPPSNATKTWVPTDGAVLRGAPKAVQTSAHAFPENAPGTLTWTRPAARGSALLTITPRKTPYCAMFCSCRMRRRLRQPTRIYCYTA